MNWKICENSFIYLKISLEEYQSVCAFLYPQHFFVELFLQYIITTTTKTFHTVRKTSRFDVFFFVLFD